MRNLSVSAVPNKPTSSRPERVLGSRTRIQPQTQRNYWGSGVEEEKQQTNNIFSQCTFLPGMFVALGAERVLDSKQNQTKNLNAKEISRNTHCVFKSVGRWAKKKTTTNRLLIKTSRSSFLKAVFLDLIC